MMLMNLNKSHPGSDDLLRKNGFSVFRSLIPLVDITIEQTINRHAKFKRGLLALAEIILLIIIAGV